MTKQHAKNAFIGGIAVLAILVIIAVIVRYQVQDTAESAALRTETRTVEVPAATKSEDGTAVVKQEIFHQPAELLRRRNPKATIICSIRPEKPIIVENAMEVRYIVFAADKEFRSEQVTIQDGKEVPSGIQTPIVSSETYKFSAADDLSTPDVDERLLGPIKVSTECILK